MPGTNSPGKYKSLFRLTAFRRQCTSVTHSATIEGQGFSRQVGQKNDGLKNPNFSVSVARNSS
jgi:hypothetical protein